MGLQLTTVNSATRHISATLLKKNIVA